MTGNAINTKTEALALNAKSEAVELHELSSEKLDAVSGGSVMEWLRVTQRILDSCNL